MLADQNITITLLEINQNILTNMMQFSSTTSTHSMMAKRAQSPMTELSVGHRARHFGLLFAAPLRFRQGGALAGLPHVLRHTGLLVSGAPAALPIALRYLLAAARVQTAGGRGSGQAVGVPVGGGLLLQSQSQGVHGTNQGFPLHT